jgi:hypothetical protein
MKKCMAEREIIKTYSPGVVSLDPKVVSDIEILLRKPIWDLDNETGKRKIHVERSTLNPDEFSYHITDTIIEEGIERIVASRYIDGSELHDEY